MLAPESPTAPPHANGSRDAVRWADPRATSARATRGNAALACRTTGGRCAGDQLSSELVSIRIEVLSENQYRVSVSPPHGPEWETSVPLNATEVREQLKQLGCHSTDVSDALLAADPDWTEHHAAEVLRRRESR
jgi:hypothetical protein